MIKNIIDDRSIAKPPYSGPKKDKPKDKKIAPKKFKAMIGKLFKGENG